MTTEQEIAKIDAWLESWIIDPVNAKTAFMAYYAFLKEQNVTLEFIERPDISYSLRAKHEGQERPLFVMVDVVDDDPEERWLSVCFYADTVQDPKELGDFVPQGLMGQDALCLNLDEDDDEMRAYILERIKEASNQ